MSKNGKHEKGSHTRSGHFRKNPDGSTTYVPPTVVQPDRPARPKKSEA